jgi:hypothetical protein
MQFYAAVSANTLRVLLVSTEPSLLMNTCTSRYRATDTMQRSDRDTNADAMLVRTRKSASTLVLWSIEFEVCTKLSSLFVGNVRWDDVF